MDLFDELLLLLGLKAVVPLGQTGFARAVLDQDELDRHPEARERQGQPRSGLNEGGSRRAEIPAQTSTDFARAEIPRE